MRAATPAIALAGDRISRQDALPAIRWNRRMKTMLAALLTSTVLLAAGVRAEPAATSPLVGRWALDIASLPMPPEARPKSVTLAFTQPDAGTWDTRIEILAPDGGRMDSGATLPLDGTPGKVTGSYWADLATATMPAPNVVVIQLAYQGTPSSTRIYSVAQDGDTLTETKAFFGQDGTPKLQTTTFTRLP